MKLKYMPLLLVPFYGFTQAAEIYNKDSNKLDFYGRLVARHQFSDTVSADGDKTYARIGFKGLTTINDTLQGFGQWEYQISGNVAEGQEGNHSRTRLAFAGLKHASLGSLDYGRNYGVIYDVESFTDILPVFGADTYTRPDTFMQLRAGGVLTWRGYDFFGLVEGLNLAIQYQGKNEDSSRAVRNQNGDGVGASLVWQSDYGLSLGTAYAGSNRTDAQQQKSGNNAGRAESLNAGIKYDTGKFLIGSVYAETRNMIWAGGSDWTLGDAGYGKWGAVTDRTRNIEVAAHYQFDNGFRPSVAYLQSRMDYNGISGNIVKYADISIRYFFNKNFSAHADWKINLLDDDSRVIKATGISTDNVLAAGMIYQF
ncbi:porin [Cedecea colo]|uniref:Porin n=1 Tax=Cedecea colo TaxID=2552946 RepID=A0ABX0VLD7_9ENTR|nr:porin [Cedecea colo]NIY47855.1 porin [Cedecea colo]